MAQYRTYPYCGANLDPGERCDCTKKSAPDAANIRDGKAGETPNTKSHYTRLPRNCKGVPHG